MKYLINCFFSTDSCGFGKFAQADVLTKLRSDRKLVEMCLRETTSTYNQKLIKEII